MLPRIAIIGGGLAGAGLALALRRLNAASVTLIERRPLRLSAESSRESIHSVHRPLISATIADRRSTALSYSSKRILETLGAWNHLAEDAAAISSIVVSERGRFGQVVLSAAESAVDALGYVAPNDSLGRSMLASLDPGDCDFELLAPADPSAAQKLADGRWRLEFDTSVAQLKPFDLLVFADGGTAAARLLDAAELQPFQVNRIDHGQHAIIANVRCRDPHEGRAFERFMDGGAIALLPLAAEPGHWYSLVLTVDSQRATELQALDDVEFLGRLQSFAGHAPGVLDRINHRDSYPLSLQTMASQTNGTVAIVGNAAHTLHPVAGQGFNLILRDITALARCIHDCSQMSELATALTRYEAMRLPDQHLTIAMTELLVDVFMRQKGESTGRTNDPVQLPASLVKAVRASRRIGFAALNALPPLRREFAQAAMGLWTPDYLQPIQSQLSSPALKKAVTKR